MPIKFSGAKIKNIRAVFPKMERKMTVAVDIDGTLAPYNGWGGYDHFGDPYPGSIEFLRAVSKFARVLIYTCRCGQERNENIDPEVLANHVKKWLDDNNLYYDDIWIGRGKPLAAAYVDDRAISCRPADNKNIFSRIIPVLESLCRQANASRD